MAGLRASDVLHAKIAMARSASNQVHRRFWARDDVTRLLPLLQEQTYHLAAASIPLMDAARDRCRAVADHDAVAAGLIDYFSEHIVEEADHDLWLLEDLECLGLAREDVTARPAHISAAQLIGAQYYWMFHEHPVALLGYMAALEGGVVDPGFVEDFLAKTGMPRAGVRTLLHHADIDVDHDADLARVLDSLPLTSRQHAVIGTSAITTVSQLAAMAHDVMEQADAALHG